MGWGHNAIPVNLTLTQGFSQPYHYEHLGPDNSFFAWKAVLCVVGGLVAFLAST